MADWMSQQVDSAEDDAEEDPKDSEFAQQLRTVTATGSVDSLDIDIVRNRIDEVDDVETLENALDGEHRSSAQDLYRERLGELGVDGYGGSDDSDDVKEEEEAESDDTGDVTESEPEVEEESEDDDAEEEESESDDSPNPFTNDSTSDDSDDATEEEAEEESEDDDSPNPFEDSSGSDEVVADGNGTAAAESSSSDNTDTDDEIPEYEPDGSPSDGSDDTGPSIDVKDIAPNVMTADEAAEKETRYTMMVWADPGQGKTHFTMTAPSPVVVIDTEGKADELAHKFRDVGQYDDPYIFQPTDYDESLDALHDALDILDAFRKEEGVIGTLAVDSMSVMWGWSQQKYVDKFYPGQDVEEVDFDSAIGGGQSDWKQIKRYHNVKFRQPMLDAPYHLIWTAMREDDYEERMKGNRDADKPAGEKENIYKVDEMIRIKEGPDGAPTGFLNKSGKIKHRYAGLRYPTFPKHEELIDTISDAENGDRAIGSVQAESDVTIVEGNPEYVADDDD